MGTNKYSLRIEAKQKVRRIPESLSVTTLRSLFEALEVSSVEYSDSELEDVLAMALGDIGEQESVKLILETLYPNQFTAGQIQNLTEELKEDCAWDEYSDLNDHEALYTCIDLLSNAFPTDYQTPSHCRLTISLEGANLERALLQHPVDEATVLRGIAQLENSESLLCRLFSEQVGGAPFPEANAILWLLEKESPADQRLLLHCHGSSYWFTGVAPEMKTDIKLV